MLYHGDNLTILPTIESDSISSCVCDPPYGLKFMGKRWDAEVPSVELWREVYRVLKPGGYLLAFFGTRTFHRGVCRVEDAGFEIRDMLAWVYGQGFPKSLDVSKAIDKAAGVERTLRVNERWTERYPNGPGGNLTGGDRAATVHQLKRVADGPLLTSDPVTDAAREWQGWGTALKPALEPIVLARKPLVGTVAENVQAHGTGALNIDGCRVPVPHGDGWDVPQPDTSRINPARCGAANGSETKGRTDARSIPSVFGRWPANLIHDGSEEAVRGFPDSKGMPIGVLRRGGVGFHGGASGTESVQGFGDSGSAARFFYCAKPSGKERGEFNVHPTVKPVELMRYLVRLVTPKGGTVLDPFLGSGTTAVAAAIEGMKWIGIESDEKYVAIARRRIFEHTV